MLFVVAASDEQWNELTGSRPGIEWVRTDDARAFDLHTNADAFFSLKDDHILPGFEALQKPVLINAVINTLTELAAPANVYRINGWPTFLNHSVWEIAGAVTAAVESVFASLNIKIIPVKDEPGLIAASVISMIINEAYFATEDNVSSKAEIDTAMKLGTNYPYGPFEWAGLIGADNISALLKKLNATDARYKPSELLIKVLTENNQ